MFETTLPVVILAILSSVTCYIFGRIDERDKWIDIVRKFKENKSKVTNTTTQSHKYDINIIFEFLAAYHDPSNEPCIHRTTDTLNIEFDGALIKLLDDGTWQWEDNNNK